MRHPLSAFVLLASLLAPLSAYANTDSVFTVTRHGLDLTFTLPTSPTPDGFDPRQDFFLGNLAFTENGMGMVASDVYFYTRPSDGGFELEDSDGNVIDGLSFTGPKLFTGPVRNPTFREGTFALGGGPACSITDIAEDEDAGSCKYPLIITTQPAAAAPEPSSLLLLGTGAGGLLGIGIRRLWS